MERKVAVAARNLGDGVQRIVMAARMGGAATAGGQKGERNQNPDEWKIRLLQLLGGSDPEVKAAREGDARHPTSDLDVLLDNSSCDKFVLRCVENELPPNLIHCLRLLRVLELQHAHRAAAIQQRSGGDPNQVETSPVSTTAASKVSKLLCLLCTDPSVGEQLRPHLFGLLALSGATYPPSGVHIATAASVVIIAFSESCLSSSLVWFLHDRKMIVHMTDDVKELCGMTDAPTPTTLCLYGNAAEAVGLWIAGVRTVVHLVVLSCHHQCLELLRDFDTAGGYHVLCYAIANSSAPRVADLLKLVTMLVYCKTDTSSSVGDHTSTDGINTSDIIEQNQDESRLASNPHAFEIIEDLMVRSVPLLSEYVEMYGGSRPTLDSTEALQDLAALSVETAQKTTGRAIHSSSEAEGALVTEILAMVLQLYSDHPKNFSVIESRYNVLSLFLLSFPTFSNTDVKVMILKNLEFVCSGIVESSVTKPLSVASEIFFSLCKTLLVVKIEDQSNEGDSSRIYENLMIDAEMLCETLIKLLQFDDSVSHAMAGGGLVSDKIHDFLQLVDSSHFVNNGDGLSDDSIRDPPESTNIDNVFAAMCSILRLLVRNDAIPSRSIAKSKLPLAPPSEVSANALSKVPIDLDRNLNLLLSIGVTELGEKALSASLSVFEAKLGSRQDDSLITDMECVIDLSDKLASSIAQSCGVDLDGSNSAAAPAVRRRRDRPWRGGEGTSAVNIDLQREGDSEPLPVGIISRLGGVIEMLCSVLEVNESAQDAFRISGGFESIIRWVLALDGAVDGASNVPNVENDGGNTNSCSAEVCASSILSLIESIMSLLRAATEPAKNKKNFFAEMISTDSSDTFSEDERIAGTSALANRLYFRQKRLYLALSTAISGTGILGSPLHALSIMNFSLAFMEPSISLPTDGRSSKSVHPSDGNGFLRNPDGARLVLALSVADIGGEIDLSTNALKEVIRLCAPENSTTSLSQLSSSGLISSLTHPQEFGPYLEDTQHPLYDLFILLLRRLASFSMTYVDFVALLRSVAGPILRENLENCAGEENDVSATKSKRIRLPVISSSVAASAMQPKLSADEVREKDVRTRLETLSLIAEVGDRVARCEIGGSSLNSLSVRMHSVPIEERWEKFAEQGRTKFLEINSVDAAAKVAAARLSSNPDAQKELVWPPFASSGFTYSAWVRIPASDSEEATGGSLFLLDLSTLSNDPNGTNYLSVWYNIKARRLSVLSSSAQHHQPTHFPLSPLAVGVWHHIFITFQPPKRTILSRKSLMVVCVDGRPLIEANDKVFEAKIDSIILPPTARVYVGVPNPVLATNGAVSGSLPAWDLGPILLLTTVLGIRDATSIFVAGPDFQGIFWGDRPQRLSLAATASATFSMLAEIGESGSVAGALRRRGVPEVEAAGHAIRERGSGAGPESDMLKAVGLLCNVSPDAVAFAFQASASSAIGGTRKYSLRLPNLARINSCNEVVATDALVYGSGSIISPHCFADNVQWIGGPNVMLPLVNAANSALSLALALRLIRESVYRHPPNLEMLQAGGGYRMLGLLLRQKRIMDANIMEQCFAFAVHGFVPGSVDDKQISRSSEGALMGSPPEWAFSAGWVFSDLDAMKYLLLNHQVWDLRRSGPELPLRLLSFLNGLVAAHSAHAAFNSRRLHLLGTVRWTLHLMLEAAELFGAGADATAKAASGHGSSTSGDDVGASGINVSVTEGAALASGWICEAPSVSTTSVGGDPDNSLLIGCKTLLRRVLTFMLTPGDLEAIAGAAIYTLSITSGSPIKVGNEQVSPGFVQGEKGLVEEEQLPPGPVARVYLIRLLEELVVDGVNEIMAMRDDKASDSPSQPPMQPHAGGGTSSNQSYLAASMMARKRNNRGQPGLSGDLTMQPNHQKAQAFLSAFANILTPVWFASVLEGCREEASASAVFRLMILMLQSSPAFASAFEEAGGFAPLVLSIPKFPTCASITMSMLSQLLCAPILHLPCFGTINAGQLCEIFDAENDSELIMRESIRGGLHTPSDPSCGIFALLAECLGRNIQLASFDNELGRKARQINEAVLSLLSHRHKFSSSFQEFCRTPDFLEPLAQALCLVYDKNLQRTQRLNDKSKAISQQEEEFADQIGANSRAEIEGVESGQTIDIVKEQDGGPDGGNEHSSLPKRDDPRRSSKEPSRRGRLSSVDMSATPTERFIGKDDVDRDSSGTGMLELLHLVLSHDVLSAPLAAPLVSALFRSFPIHASLDQVEAFHLVLIERCQSVVEDALQRGEPIAIANCVGVCSVLLDRLIAGFFTSEPILDSLKMILKTLAALMTPGSYASRTLGQAEQSMLLADAAYFTRLACLAALQRSHSIGPYDSGDDELKIAVLESVGANLRQWLLIPGGIGQNRQGGGAPANPAPGTRLHVLWQSGSLTRCCPPSVSCTFPDLTAMNEPDRAFIASLLTEIRKALGHQRPDIREQAVDIIVTLLQQRRGIMSELLTADVPRDDGRMETYDLISRGGFGALLAAHEAAKMQERGNVSTVPRRERTGSSSTSKKYASFFDWYDKNNAQVAAVFHSIQMQVSQLLPGFDVRASTPDEAIENEQKVMLLKLTAQDSSDRTILGGLERAELAQRSYDKTAESHALWKRRGFDDLSSGAMQWKFLLRQLKGSCSIWEGGLYDNDESPFSTSAKLLICFQKNKKNCGHDETNNELVPFNGTATISSPDAIETVTRWKLDLTEGYERQRRRLLPNYEFFSLYNLDESFDTDKGKKECTANIAPNEDHAGSVVTETMTGASKEGMSFRSVAMPTSSLMEERNAEATAELLKELNLGPGKAKLLDEDEDEDELEDDLVSEGAEGKLNSEVILADEDASTMSPSDANDHEGLSTAITVDSTDVGQPTALHEGAQEGGDGHDTEDLDGIRNKEVASSYDLITGLIAAGDWPEKSYNVKRCTGLEVRQALLLWCRDAIYIIDGFEQTEGEGLEGKIKRLEKSNTTYYINLRQDGSVSMDVTNDNVEDGQARSYQPVEDRVLGEMGNSKKDKAGDDEIGEEEITYQHRSQRVPFSDLYSVFRRRYQLQHIALEFYDVHKKGTLIAFSNNAEREEVLTKVLSSNLPNSIFSSSLLVGSTSINYKKFMNSLRQKITNQWVQGRITNFDFIMHLNSFAGRTYNDLTQYPVFPWVLSNYDSDEIDLDDPTVYRDLSKPMGGQGAQRAVQFQERYEALESNYLNDDEPPPFHYGTHYSCAAYVLYYLMRLEPFSRLALSLQGGRFDVADRLFHDVGASWKSASTENLQDVRELIPEFFYLPEFLENSNNFDFGTTQSGKVVHHATLPKWAKGDPRRFVRINRQALESEHVSKHLHKWADLIFGYKQRGQEAVKALNTFVHVTYEGTVDLDQIEDPIQRDSIIAQIQNFGQTPSRLVRKPFPGRNIVSMSALAALTPPFCVVGAQHRVYVRATVLDTCRVGMVCQTDSSVGDLCLVKGQLVGVGKQCALILPTKKYFRYGGPNNGASVHVAVTSGRFREVDRVLSIHDGMHRSAINVAKPSLNGLWLVTGCVDSTVRVWRYDGKNVHLQATLCGHEGGMVTCIDVSTTFGTIVSGDADGNILVWDIRTLTFVRKLRNTSALEAGEDLGSSAISVSINHKNGNILTLVGSMLSIFDINGIKLASFAPGYDFASKNRPSLAISTNCPEWMEDGVVAVTGHVNGDVRLWGLEYEEKALIMCHQLPDKVHSCPITALRVSGDLQDTLLVGDKSGKMSMCKTLQPEAF